MATLPIIPVHIIIDDEIIESKAYREILDELTKTLAKDISIKVRVFLSVIRAGFIQLAPTDITPTGATDPKIAMVRFDDEQRLHHRIDLRGALARVFLNLDSKLGSNLSVIIIILGTKTDNWGDVYNKIYDKYHSITHLFWICDEGRTRKKMQEIGNNFRGIPNTNVLKNDNKLKDSLHQEVERIIRSAIDIVQNPKNVIKHTPQPPAGFVQQPTDQISRTQIQPAAKTPRQPSQSPMRPQNKSVEPTQKPLPQPKTESQKTITQPGDQPAEYAQPFTDQNKHAIETGLPQKPSSQPDSAHPDTIIRPKDEQVEQVPSDLDNTESEVTPEQKPPPPPPKPAQWEYHEPPKDMGDRKAHKYTQFSNKPCAYGWYMLCASRRGRLHEHEATFREDAVRIDSGNNWHLIAVADGAGSADLSRLGSELVVDAAIKEMRAYVKSQAPSAAVAEVACRKALEAAWTALYKTADERQIPFKDLATTLLLLAYHPQLKIVGYAQVGDGLIVAQKDDGELVLLGEPESGEYSGQTYFMTNYEHDKLASKSRSLEAKNPLRLFFVMSDGVSDDLYPPLERVMGLVTPLPKVLTSKDPGEALYDLIGYERAGSFDDRTLAVLCHKKNVIQKTPPPLPIEKKEDEKKGVEYDAKPAASAEKQKAPRKPDVVVDKQGGMLPSESPESKPESEENQKSSVDNTKQTPPVDDPRSTEEPDSLKTKGASQGGLPENDQKDTPLSK